MQTKSLKATYLSKVIVFPFALLDKVREFIREKLSGHFGD